MKVQIGKSVVFGGVQISYNPTLESVDMAPEEKKIEAIRSMSVPTNKKSAQSLLGYVSQLNSFFPEITKRLKKHKALVCQPEQSWRVTEELERESNDFQIYLDRKLHLSPIRPGEELIMFTDASISGLGFLLCQEINVTIDGDKKVVRNFINLG